MIFFIILRQYETIIITFWAVFFPFVFGQILTINSGASVSVASGSSINLDGLEIAPADTYVISGANDMSRSITAATAGGNNSVLRLYSTSALLSGFTGTLTFSYLDDELNGIAEGDSDSNKAVNYYLNYTKEGLLAYDNWKKTGVSVRLVWN